MTRFGQGFDAHKLVAGRPLILGGVRIPYELGLLGHSDADVLTHAVIDSILGALALGDIGTWFPDNEKHYFNADSLVLLKTVLEDQKVSSWSLVNLDTTIVAQQPKLSPHIISIRQRLSDVFKCCTDRISVKAKTTEGMGFCGRGEGIAVLSNISLCNDKS